MQIFCYIPQPCVNPGGDLAHQVREKLNQALALGLTPIPLPRGLSGKAVRLDEGQLEPVNMLAKEHGLAPGRVVGGLIYALHVQGVTQAARGSASPSSQDGIAPVVDGLQPGQVRCLMEAAPMFRDGKIVAAECGTGSGKSRIIAHAAAYLVALRNGGKAPPVPGVGGDSQDEDMPEFIRDHAKLAREGAEERRGLLAPDGPRAVIIAAPSVENVSHLAREWAAVKPAIDPRGLIGTALVLGRGQFVSPTQLQIRLLDSEGGYPEIQAWLDAGMPAGVVPATRYLHQVEPSVCGLMADLEALAATTDFDASVCALDEDAPSEEQEIYRSLREKAFTADVVWTTHAMFCMDNMRLTAREARPLLPPALAVLIDEAHMLESAQSAVASKSMSFQRILTELKSPLWVATRRQTAAQDVAAKARRVIDALGSMPHETPMPVLNTGNAELIRIWTATTPAIHDLHDSLRALSGKIDTKANANAIAQYGASLRYIERCVFALEQIRKDYHGIIEHSPKRGSLSFQVGPSSVDKYINARWVVTPTAMLLSGMLHYIGQAGANLQSYHREVKVPAMRRASTVPIHPAWVSDTPVLYTPAPEIFHRFVPPSKDEADEQAMTHWLRECAKVINLAASDAAGGMLVLMSGFDRLNVLAKVLMEHYPKLQGRLLAQSRISRIASIASIFKERARAGERPIWLATGSAWTGLDLADETVDASLDRILTDLVIPNVPFGLQRGTTHVARVNRMGFGAEAMATQRLFRNGLGRGVRRQGLSNRRYWVLDGRLQHPATLSYTADLRAVLQRYLHRKTFAV